MAHFQSVDFVQLAWGIFGKISTVIHKSINLTATVDQTTDQPETTDITDHAIDLIGQPPELGKVMMILIGLIVGLFLCVWLVKRGFTSRFGKSGKGQIQVIEARPISPKTMLYLVDVRGKKFLMAESQLEVKRIGDVDFSHDEDES